MDTKYNNQNQEIDLYMALDLLDIDQKIPCINLTHEYVKRKYHKMALRLHPDKNGNTIEATQKFQRINEAYTYLVSEFVSSSDSTEDNLNQNNPEQTTNDNMYTSLLSVFLSSILQVNSKIVSDLLVKVIKDIVINLIMIMILIVSAEHPDEEHILHYFQSMLIDRTLERHMSYSIHMECSVVFL